jgi:hypothetical protein
MKPVDRLVSSSTEAIWGSNKSAAGATGLQNRLHILAGAPPLNLPVCVDLNRPDIDCNTGFRNLPADIY